MKSLITYPKQISQLNFRILIFTHFSQTSWHLSILCQHTLGLKSQGRYLILQQRKIHSHNSLRSFRKIAEICLSKKRKRWKMRLEHVSRWNNSRVRINRLKCSCRRSSKKGLCKSWKCKSWGRKWTLATLIMPYWRREEFRVKRRYAYSRDRLNLSNRCRFILMLKRTRFKKWHRKEPGLKHSSIVRKVN
jgi:hypothetical protein